MVFCRGGLLTRPLDCSDRREISGGILSRPYGSCCWIITAPPGRATRPEVLDVQGSNEPGGTREE